MADGGRRAFIDAPAKRIDEGRDETAQPRKREDSDTDPVPSEQGHTAERANDQQAEQEAAMQIGPKDHDHRQQEPSRSLQAFAVEDDGKQHRGRVRRGGDIDIRGRRERGVKQAREKDGNANGGCRGAEPQT